MIAKAAILFLFGTTLISGQLWPQMAPYGAFKAPSKSTGCPSGPEMAPLICKLSVGQIKPQLIAPTTYIAPLVVEKCDSPQLQMDIEMSAPVENAKPQVIPQPPELPPMTTPKFPVPVITEAPTAPIPEPCISADIPVIPDVNIPADPEIPPFEIHELPEIAAALAPLPAAPELPAFTMPELPHHEQDEPITAPIPAHIEPLAPLPAAPELPAFTMPEMRNQMVELPNWYTEEKAPILRPIPAHFEPLAPVPAAPELPAFTMPEMPKFSTPIENPSKPVIIAEPEPRYTEEKVPIPSPIPANIEPLAPLSAVPELPAFTMPEIPNQMVELLKTPCLIDESIPFVPIPAYRQPEPEYNMVDYQPMTVPQPPELPASVMPELPVYVAEQELPMPAVPSHEDLPAPIVAIPKYIEPLAPIPPAPELPSEDLPEFAIRMEISSKPVIIAEAEPRYTEEKAPIPAPIPAHFEPLAPRPAAPELPAFTMPAHNVAIPKYIEPLVPIPAAPELPPANLPKFSTPIENPSKPVIIAEPEPRYTEEKAPTPSPIPANIEPLAPLSAVPELPAFTMPEIPNQMVELLKTPCLIDESIPFVPIPAYRQPEPEYNMVDYQSMTVPQPPELPAFEMPELPVYVAEQELPMPAAPSHEDFPAPIVAIPKYIESLAPIPTAPELPPANLPKFTIQMENPSKPVIFAEPEPRYTEEKAPIPSPISAHIEPLAPLPAAPELPAFTMPEMPNQMEELLKTPCLIDESIPFVPIPAYRHPEPKYNMVDYQPMTVPQPPELPAFEMPELPVYVAEQELPMPAAPSHEDFPAPIVAIPKYIEPLAPIPTAPELPPANLPKFTTPIEIPSNPVSIADPEPSYTEEKAPIPAPIPAHFEPLAPRPAAPELPAFTMPAHNVAIPKYIEPLVPIPAAPELPPANLPKFSTPIENPSKPVIIAEPEPRYTEEKVPIPSPIPANIEPLAPLSAVPELPAFTMPEIPNQMVELLKTPCLIDESIPFVPIPAYRQPEPEYNMVDYQPMTVPQPPELPASVMPELPVYVAEQELPMPAVPSHEDLPAPIVAIPKYIEPLAPIPPAPELPSEDLPEFAIRMEISSKPVIIAEPEPRYTEEKAPISSPIPAHIEPLAPLPAAPELPAFTMPAPNVAMPKYIESLAPIPAAPELPPANLPKFTIQMEIPSKPVIIAEPELRYTEEKAPIQSPIPAHIKPLAPLSAAPELPAFTMPEMPNQMEELLKTPCLIDESIPFVPIPAYRQPEPEYNMVHYQPMTVPQPPELPASVMPELPVYVAEQELPMPTAPSHEDFPAPIVAIPKDIEPLAPIPPAPELPSEDLPEFAIRMEISSKPVIIAEPEPRYTEEKAPISSPIPAHIGPLAPLPAAPELPVFTKPEMPNQMEELLKTPCLIDESIPFVPIPAYRQPEPKYYQPTTVPQPPKLPAFEMPELPVYVAEQELPMPAAPSHEDFPAPIVAIPKDIEPLAPIPPAPELPSEDLPEFAIRMEISSKPVIIAEPEPRYTEEKAPISSPIPAHIGPLAPLPAAPELPVFTKPEMPNQMEELLKTPCLIDESIPFVPIPAYRQPEPKYNMVDYQPTTVPQPPKLPAFEMPELPVYVAEQELPMPAAPSHEDFPAPIVAIPKYFEPLAPIPAAPELPPANLPKFTIQMEIPSKPVIIAEPEPRYTEEKAALEPISILQPPKLPEINMPELPDKVVIEESIPCEPSFVMPNPFYQKLFPSLITYNEKAKKTQNVLLPPMDGAAYPTPCVYNSVMKHVVPNMVSNKFRSKDKI